MDVIYINKTPIKVLKRRKSLAVHLRITYFAVCKLCFHFKNLEKEKSNLEVALSSLSGS